MGGEKMNSIKIDLENVYDHVSKSDIFSFQNEITKHHKSLLEKSGKGSDYLGWLDLASKTDNNIIDSIKVDALRIQQIAEVFVVIGIGGSYLGARAVIEALKHQFSSLLDKEGFPEIVYAGQNISEDYLSDLIDILDKKEYALAVISKSGTTTEPAIAFRIIKEHLEKKYGKEESKKRIVAITDKKKGALKELADDENYSTYVVPDDVGGRYSVLTPVGLLPIAVAGFDIESIISGLRTAEADFLSSPILSENNAALYAAVRNGLYRKGKLVECLVSYQPNLFYIIEWWKQLFGESEGKENKGILPVGLNFTTDLHSMGQYMQEGERILFETVISVENSNRKLNIPEDNANLDGLNYIANKRIHDVNKEAENGTTLAHKDGGVPVIKISIPEINEYCIGQLLYFFEISCALSGYILGVNPFDQPGVEQYKRNMFALLGKPGFEEETKVIRERLTSRQ